MAAKGEFAYIEGLASLRRLLKPPSDELVNEPWRDAMTELADTGAEAGRSRGPHRSGLMTSAGKLYARVQNKPFPMWAAVRSRAKRKSRKYPRGYSYPTLLEYSSKYGHAGWFTSAVEPRLVGAAEGALAKAASEVERRWGRQ